MSDYTSKIEQLRKNLGDQLFEQLLTLGTAGQVELRVFLAHRTIPKEIKVGDRTYRVEILSMEEGGYTADRLLGRPEDICGKDDAEYISRNWTGEIPKWLKDHTVFFPRWVDGQEMAYLGGSNNALDIGMYPVYEYIGFMGKPDLVLHLVK